MAQRKKKSVWPLAVLGVILLFWQLPALLIGLVMLPTAGAIGLLFLLEPLLVVIAAVVLLLKSVQRGPKRYVPPASHPWNRRRPDQPPPPQSSGEIPSNALDVKGQLRQLETLRDAGLLTQAEYRARREKILRSR